MKNKGLLFTFLLLVFSIIIYSCKKDYTVVDIDESDEPYILEYGNMPAPQIASDNPLTREGVKLGRMLFYEKMLSSDGSQSCGSCHKQENAFSDIRQFSLGVKGLPGHRQAMAIFNMAWNSNNFFWDGRATLLRDQALMPIEDTLEMNETLPNVVKKLQASTLYPPQFKRAFGTEIITAKLMSLAMEQFMNTIVSHNSRFDQFDAGTGSFTSLEQRGRYLFFTEYNPNFPSASGADCVHCHGSGHKGVNYENDRYMNNGLDTDASITDKGRELVTNNPTDRGKFKVPSLRNVELTPPYMHDGRFNTLEEVIEHYNLVKPSSNLDAAFAQQLPNGGLNLSEIDKAALLAFLKTLTDTDLTNNPAYSDPF